MTEYRDGTTLTSFDNSFEKLPDHLLIEIFVRVPVSEWAQICCVKKGWAVIFHGECLWKAALTRKFPLASQARRWPGPIPRGLSKSLPACFYLFSCLFSNMTKEHGYLRRFAALCVSKHISCLGEEVDEIVGHAYLFLKEQLELSTIPPSFGVLCGTIIDQFIACGKSRDEAHELSSRIWLAVLDNLEENEHTFLLLKLLALEGNIFLPYPYSRFAQVQWRVFEKLFTDFRDCFSHADYYDVLTVAKNKFHPIPSSWLGY